VFPRLARSFFGEKGLSVEVVPVSGAAEVAPHLGIADVVVDLTSTGNTLRTNGLKEVCTLLESTARLIARPGLGAERTRALGELQDALASVLRARGKRYLMANVPRAKLDAIREVLPGLNGPTVVELYGGGPLVAVHAVVAEASLYRTVSALKALGGEGILVTRIERLLP
jgi:ATP phosphoribosyltransferase